MRDWAKSTLGLGLLLAPMAALSKDPPPAMTAPVPGSPGFNKSEIQALYFSGDFEPLTALLENLRHQRRLRDREDSAFIFKYLGVIYGADETTRKKAESFLYAMLKLDPAANLADMGVGDNIETLFAAVQKRYQTTYRDTTFDRQRQIILRQWAADSLRRDSLRRAEEGESEEESVPTPAAPVRKMEEDRGGGKWIWIAAGGAALAATAGLVIAFSGDPDRTIDTVLTPLR